MKKKTLLIKTADLCIRIHYKYPYIEQQCETWRVNEGYEPDIEVSVTDEEIETEYAGYRAESVSRALCERVMLFTVRWQKDNCLRHLLCTAPYWS